MAGLIPDHVLDQVRNANDIVDVIGSRLPDLKRAGSAFKCRCPFHKEKTPSFNVNPQRQLFKCFGCGAGGDVIKFVMLWERLEFREAVELLAQKAGIKLEFTTDRNRSGGGSQKEILYRLHEEAAAFFHWQLMKEPSAQIARDYLKKRKVNSAAAREFLLGYSPDSWDAILQWAASRKHPPSLLVQAGLVVARDGGGFYDRFRGRLMFTIRDEQGRVVGFSGRVLTGDEKTAKYVNSPESPIFTKGRVLYGLDKTKRAIIEAKHVIVCEGQLDLIACYTAGVQNIVASQGTAFTPEHGRILKRYAEEVVLCFDSDAAGQKATVSSVDGLLAAGLIISVVSMPAGHDPDSLVREEGPERLRAVIKSARPFFDFHLDYLCARHNEHSDLGKVQISRALAASLMKVDNAVLRVSYVQRSAARLGVPESALLEEMGKVRRATERMEEQPITAAAPEAVVRPAALPAEKMLMQLMLTTPEVLALTCQAVDPLWFTQSAVGEMLLKIQELQTAGQWRGTEQMLDTFPERQDLLAELLVSFKTPPNPQHAAQDCIRRLQERWTRDRINRLTEQLRQPDLSPEEIGRIQKQILDLRN